MISANRFPSLVSRFQQYKTAEGARKSYVDDIGLSVNRVARDCGFDSPESITKSGLNAWLYAAAATDEYGECRLSPKTRNKVRQYFSMFCQWLMSQDVLNENPVNGTVRAKKSNSVRNPRRALTVDELRRLFKVARLRPLIEYARSRLAGRNAEDWERATCKYDQVDEYVGLAKQLLRKDPERLEALEHTGRHRELVYKTLALTGLRCRELDTLIVGDIGFAEQPFIKLRPENEKNGNGSRLPICQEIAAELAGWIDEHKLGFKDRVLEIPGTLIKVFHRDCKTGEIPKFNQRGERLVLHSLRHTYATMLVASNVAPKVAQECLRHGDVRLTLQIYTHLEDGEVSKAVNMLPKFSESYSVAAPSVSVVAPSVEIPKPMPVVQADLTSTLSVQDQLLLAILRKIDPSKLIELL